MKAIESWTWPDVRNWLLEQPALARYAKNELKGTTGKELLEFSKELLQDIITNPLHRLQLINRRDELVASRTLSTTAYPKDGSATSRAKVSRPVAASTEIQTKAVSKETSPPAQSIEVVELADEGPYLTTSAAVPEVAHALVADITACYRLSLAACYNAANCETLQESLLELQMLLLQNTHLFAHAGLLAKFMATAATIKDLFSLFSARGWLARLETGDLADKRAFEMLDAELMALAGNGYGVEVMEQEEAQEYTDDTGKLQQFLREAGGFAALKATNSGSAQRAFAQMDHLFAKVVKLMPAEDLEEEATYLECQQRLGPHSVLRNASMQLFWFKQFPKQDEASLESFWASFPKNLPRAEAVELSDLFSDRLNREMLQAVLGRSNPRYVTPADLDFNFPPDTSVMQSCRRITEAGHAWRGTRSPVGSPLSRENSGHQPGSAGFLPPLRAHLEGVEDTREELCDLFTDRTAPIQLVIVTGPPGSGKTTAAVAGAQRLLAEAHWESAYWADLCCCWSTPAITHALLAAFGIAADTPDTNPLQVLLSRKAQTCFGLLIRLPHQMPEETEGQLIDLLQLMLKTAPQLQITIMACSAIPITNINAAELEMQPLSEQDSNLLLQAGCKTLGVGDTELLSQACGGLPLTIRLVIAALSEGLMDERTVLENLSRADLGDERLLLPMWLSCMLPLLPEALKLVQLSILPGSFETAAAADVLGQFSCPMETALLLRKLHSMGLVEMGAGQATWRLQNSVRAAAAELGVQLQLPLISARTAFADRLCKVLSQAAALHPMAPASAARMVDRDAHHLMHLISWATAVWPELNYEEPVAAQINYRCLPAFSRLVWDCMPLLGPRLEITDRLTFCELLRIGAKAAGDSLAESRALWQIGAALTEAGSWREAEPPLTQSLTLLEASVGSFHLDIARVCNSLAIVYYKVGLLEKSQDMYARAYDIQSAKLGPEHPDVAYTMNHTAGLLKVMGKYGDAESVYRAVLAMRESSLGPHHLEVAASLNNLAVLLKTVGANEEAEALYTRSISIKEMVLGANHPQVSLSLNNLAALLRKMDKNDKAEELYRKALAIREDALGADNPQVAASYSNLAGLLKSLNRLSEALPFARKALEIKVRSHPAHHPELAAAHLALAELLKDLAQYSEALTLVDAAVAMLKVAVGPDNPNVATALAIKVGVLRGLGRSQEAEVPARKALAIRESSFGTESKEAGSAYHCLAEVLTDLQRYEEAEEACRNAVEIWEEKSGPATAVTCTSLELLAKIMRATMRIDEAEAIFRSCLLTREGRPPVETLEVASVLVELALLLESKGQLEEGEDAARRALAIRERILGSQHPDVGIALLGLGRVVFQAGREEEAQAQLEKAVNICTLKLGREHFLTVSAREWLQKCTES